MARYLLDSDAVIDYLLGISASVSLIRDLNDRGDSLCVCDVVVAEVFSGLKPHERGDAAELLTSFVFLSTEAHTAEQAGMWRYDYARRGIAISTTDALVAATAHAHRAVVVTANVRDYPMDEVAVQPLPRNVP